MDFEIKDGEVIMIPMPMNYNQILNKSHISPAQTLYNLEKPYDNWQEAWYYTRNHTSTAVVHGEFNLLYALKSFPYLEDERRYALYFVSTDGIFIDIHRKTIEMEPIDFRDVYARPVSSFKTGDLVTLHPLTKSILILKNVRYTEVINGVGYPNTYYSEMEDIDIKDHYILLESSNHSPIKTEYNLEFIKALRTHRPYIWVRRENYIPIQVLRFWRQNF
jgi:hypothetical protein